MAKKATGFDCWQAEALLLRLARRGTTVAVHGFERVPVENGGLVRSGPPIGRVAAGLTGRDLILKYTRVPRVPDWQLAKLIDFEVQEMAGQVGGDLAFDYNLLPVESETGEDIVLMALVKSEALARASLPLAAQKGSVEAFTPNAVALFNAWLVAGEVTEDKTRLVAWIGEQSIDLALVRGTSLLFSRNVSGGLQVLDGAIAQAFNVREERAQKIRRELLNLDPRARGHYGSSQEEKVSHSVQGVSGQIGAALRSTLAFCKSQTGVEDLPLDGALICGPGARVRGMAPFLAESLGCPVDVWSPAAWLDKTGCPQVEVQALEAAGPEAAIALGLAVGGCLDDAYSIEILPEAVKRRRRFAERTVYNLVAGVLAVAFLGWQFVSSRDRHASLDVLAAQATTKLRNVKGVHDRTQRLLDQNEEKRQQIARLHEVAVPLHGTLRFLREMRTGLPQDLWLTKVLSEVGAAPWAASATPSGDKPAGAPPAGTQRKQVRRPYVVVEGAGAESGAGNLQNQVFPSFDQMLRERGVPVRDLTTNVVSGFRFAFKVDYLDSGSPTGKQGG